MSTSRKDAKDAKDAKDTKGADSKHTTCHEALIKQDKKVQAPLSTALTKCNYNPAVKGEAMSVDLPNELCDLILGYLDGDVIAFWINNRQEKTFSSEERQQFMLFGKRTKDLLGQMGCQKAALIANFILRGEEEDKEEKDIEKRLTLVGVLDSVKKSPNLVGTQCIATDPLGRRIQGTLLQIVAMAGDVNLIEGEIKEEKDRGLVERLKTAAGLSDEEVRVQLEEVLTSKEAVAENKKCDQFILDAVKAFGEGVILKANEYKGDKEDYRNFREFQLLCQPLIDPFEKALTSSFNTIIKAGYIFDLQILHDAAKWFEDNVERFGSWWTIQSDVFWVNGFGKLQSKLSSRDAQVIRAGIGYLVDDKQIPVRTLLNDNGPAYFYKLSSRLGLDFFLGYHARAGGARSAPVGARAWPSLQSLCRAKTAALQNLCNIRSLQNRGGV